MNPIQQYLKLARAVHVKAHIRHEADGDIVEVDAHERDIDDVAAEPIAGAETEVVVPEAASLIAPDELAEEPPPPEPPVAIREHEMAMWREWNDSGRDPEKLQPLLDSFAPLIRLKMSPYLGRVKLIPDSAIETEFKLKFAEALRTYNPEKSSLSTHVFRYLDKAKRFIAEKQNVGRIPENRIYKIKQYQTAVEGLKEELDASPTPAQIAEKLGWSLPETKRMASELRADLTSQAFEEDPYNIMPSRAEEVLRLFQYELSGNELSVYQYLTGYGKPRKKSTGDIAKELGIPDYQVSRYKASIEKKLRDHLDN